METSANSPLHYLRHPTLVRIVPSPKDYTKNCETLHHRSHQGRHAIHMHPLRAQREHPGIRREERQPPHASRDRHQPARHQGTPAASDVFLARSPATHLARVILAFTLPRTHHVVILSEVDTLVKPMPRRSRRTRCMP